MDFIPPSRDAEPSAFVIWLLRFVISSLAKKLVLECFYQVWQNLTSQVLSVVRDFVRTVDRKS
ncbi:hypothetical protein IH970_13525 [candidate division KSB1 bacterium]|nr:hypothetical protein [candidate division KSB1 bacterium]